MKKTHEPQRRKKVPARKTPLALPCRRCRRLAEEGVIRAEMVQPLPEGALAPLARDGSSKCCHDCAAADGLAWSGRSMAGEMSFAMARIAVGNARQEQLRLPGVRMGLVHAGFVRPSKPGDLERHHAWLDAHDWFGLREDRE